MVERKVINILDSYIIFYFLKKLVRNTLNNLYESNQHVSLGLNLRNS